MDKTQKRLLLISLGISITVLFLFLFFTIDKETLQALESANIWLISLKIKTCWLYGKALLPDLQERIERIKYTDGAKFFEEKRQAVFPERDFHLCTAVNSCNFILRLKKDLETGLDYMERVDVPEDCQ